MNSNLKEIIDVLVKNIARSDVEIDKNLTNNLMFRVESDEIKSLMKVKHIRRHKNILMSIKNCSEKHCLECIAECNVNCEHGKKINLFEKALFKYSCEKIGFLDKENVTRKKCFKCMQLLDSKNFIKDSCFCECFSCILSQYKQYQYYCSYCTIIYNNSEIYKISKNLKQFIRLYCLKCFKFLSTSHNNPQNLCDSCMAESIYNQNLVFF